MPRVINVLLFLALINIASIVAVAVPKAFAAASPECIRKCSSCPETPSCPPGVSLVLDKCGCCKTCARQLGETCSEDKKCDPHKNLYCSYADVDEQESLCAAMPGRSCFSGGQTYVNGESFDVGCKVTCTCIDGYLGCMPKCPVTITASAPKNCLHPKLVIKPKKCCEEWICSGNSINNTTDTNPEPSPSHIRHRMPNQVVYRRPHVLASARKAQPIAISIRPRDKCKVQTTEWSSCSKTCGWGVSERVITDKACKLRKQTRLCQLRPCNTNFLQDIKKGKKCARTVKSQRKVRYSFSKCHSKVYTPKYCGACKDERCCQPKHTITKAVKFVCPDGYRFKKRMMVIRSCQCNRNCPQSKNDIFSSYRRMSGDTWKE